MIADLALITALLTAFYVGRMVLLVFFGETRLKRNNGGGEVLAYKVPLVIIAAFSLWL